MAQVGQLALAVDASAARARAGPRPASSSRSATATPFTRSTRAHWCRRRWSSSQSSSSADATRSAVQPRNGVSAAERGAWRRRRALDRLEQAQPVARRRGAEDAARAVDDGGDADLVEGVADERGVAVGADEDGDVAGADALAPLRRAVLRADLDLGARRRAARRGRPRGPWRCARARTALLTLPPRVSFERRLVAVDDPDAQRRRDGRAGEPRRLVGVGGPDRAVDDALVPELGAAEQRVVGVDEALVAAPVDLERRARVGAALAASR